MEDADIQPLKKVTVQAIDMDWLFQEHNIEAFIGILSERTFHQHLTLKPIKIFIELLWQKIQKRIICYVLVPYLMYLFGMYKLTGICLMNFIEYHSS